MKNLKTKTTAVFQQLEENMDVSFPYPGSGVDMSSDNNIADPVLSDSEFSSLTSSDEEESNDSDENNMECPNVPNDISFEDGLRRWALETNQRHCAINSLLALVRETTPYKVSKDARTFLKTPQSTEKNNISTTAGGQLWYYGIAKRLQQYFKNKTPKVDLMKLDFSMDGLPLHKSGLTQFWPILMRIHGMPKTPVMVVAIYCGECKPDSVEEYLRESQNSMNCKSKGFS
uniref:Uncharacterized protein n=1 Tax=Anopheles quadriannulatus TaxID=34691 RepID=A0A182XPR8_ANOQN